MRTAAQAQSSSLVGNRNFLEYADLWQQLDKDYFEQAKKSLALLTNLEEIEFRTCALEPGNDSEIKRRFQYRWTVGIKEESLIEAGPDSCLDEMPIENLRISYFDVSYRSAPSPWSSVDNWLVVSAFLSKDAFEQSCSLKDIPQKVFASGDDGSIPAVAVAVQLNNKPLRNGNFYSSLPLPAPTGLPIHCHGHFAMSSDRRSFRIDGEAGKWNRYLAEQCLPHLYFALLEQLCLRETANYYAYWPKGNASNVISNDLVSSFWKNIPQSSRQVVFAPNGVALPLCYTILDGRVIPPINGIVIDPITNFVQANCPEHTVIHEPVLNAGLLYRPDELVNFRLTFDQSLSVLTPAFVGELLRKKYAITILKSSTLHSLRKILDFVMEPDDKSLERILGCYILRLANGDLVRLTRRDPESKVFYLSDQEGFGLFNPLAPDRFIDPAAVCRRNWSFDGEKYNVQSLNGPIIDDLICNSFPAELIQTGKPPETTFIRRLWEYVTKKKFQVTFWQTRAMLPLQHDISTFISMKAWDKLPVMPPNIPEDMAKVCCSLKIHILRTIELPAVVALEQSTKIPRDERFLECILRSQGNSIDKLAGIQFKLQDVYVQNSITWLTSDSATVRRQIRQKFTATQPECLTPTLSDPTSITALAIRMFRQAPSPSVSIHYPPERCIH